MSRSAALQISADAGTAPLSPAQKRFNTLIRQIEQARGNLAAWHEGVAAYREAYVRLLAPLRQELLAAEREWVFALDEALGRQRWTRAEQALLRELVCDAVAQLLQAGDDAALKALFDKHAEVDYDTEQRQAMLAMKGLAEAMTGLDLGEDEGLDDEADLMDRMQQGLERQAEAEQARQAERAAGGRGAKARQRREAEAQQATQSVREVYRKLASALHPDREADAAQREHKTLLMQRVNQAYAANDLLALLELQLEIEQIDASHIALASAERLKHYNKVLNEQLGELRAEIADVETTFCVEFGLTPQRALQPRKLGQLIDITKREWLAERAQQRQRMRMLGDPAAAKRWLKQERRRREHDEFGFNPF